MQIDLTEWKYNESGAIAFAVYFPARNLYYVLSPENLATEYNEVVFRENFSPSNTVLGGLATMFEVDRE